MGSAMLTWVGLVIARHGSAGLQWAVLVPAGLHYDRLISAGLVDDELFQAQLELAWLEGPSLSRLGNVGHV